jgi:transcriptional regulator with XRE-family HTH domain
MDKINFIKWLETELKERNWGPSNLAKAAGVYPATISKILNQERQIGPEVCVAIADALDYPPEHVFRVAGLLPPSKDKSLTLDETDLLHAWRRLSPDEQKLTLIMIRALAQSRR